MTELDGTTVLDWIEGMIQLDPAKRITAKSTLNHAWLSSGPILVPKGYDLQMHSNDLIEAGVLVEDVDGIGLIDLLKAELDHVGLTIRHILQEQ